MILDNHKNIAVDIDETLINGGLASLKIQKYILENNFEKNFFLITFRTGTYVDTVWQDIAYENDEIIPAMFKGLYSIPGDIRDAYAKFNWYKRMNFIHDPEIEARMEELEELANQYTLWKGFQAKKLNCTILIDDLREMVINGCNKYGVTYVHPEDL